MILDKVLTEGAGGVGQGDGGGCGTLYSTVQSVHRVGDEKGETGQRWSMKSARLSRDSGPIDQNQTAGTVSDDDRMFQNNRHAVKSRILLWEGVFRAKLWQRILLNATINTNHMV